MSEKEHKCFILETHSEHLILRIQKRIRKGVLLPSSVSINYLHRDIKSAKCLNIRMDKNGAFLDEWPGGFFEEGYREIFED